MPEEPEALAELGERHLGHRHVEPAADRRDDLPHRHALLADARPALLEHRVDAVVTRLPFPTDGLAVTVLHDEPRVLVVPLDHRLAGRESVTVDDIADEPMPRIRGADPEWSACCRLEPRPGGRPAPDGPEIVDLEGEFEMVASGHAAVVVSASMRRYLRPDLTTVPLVGVAPSQVVVATRAGDRGGLVAAFRRAAQALLVGPEPG